MCLRNLFNGDVNCTWLLFIIVLILLIDDGCNNGCDNGYTTTRNNGCGCGC